MVSFNSLRELFLFGRTVEDWRKAMGIRCFNSLRELFLFGQLQILEVDVTPQLMFQFPAGIIFVRTKGPTPKGCWGISSVSIPCGNYFCSDSRILGGILPCLYCFNSLRELFLFGRPGRHPLPSPPSPFQFPAGIIFVRT